MQRGEAIKIAARGGINHLIQKSPRPIRKHLLKPTNIYIMITRDCNLRCVMCGIPDDVWPHLTVEQWKTILDDIADWAGGYCKVQFSGGEPLIYKGFFDVLGHAVRQGLLPGICTNATTVREKQAHQLMTMGLANVNVSLDGVGEVQNRIRGFNAVRKTIDAWSKTDRGIRNLVQARKDTGSTTPIILKTCLMGSNAANVPDILNYAQEVGVESVMFQPLELREVEGHGQTINLLGDTTELIAAVDYLIEAQAKGAPVGNTSGHLQLFKAYFTDPTSGKYEGHQQCNVGDTSLQIHSDGRMTFCEEIGMLPNATEVPPSVAWKSHIAEMQRREIGACPKGCLQTCYMNKSLKSKAKAFLLLAKGGG
jgi:MoaA/NifB/PqqE/SkfB family radical SAM enzyme